MTHECEDCGDTFDSERGLAVHRGYKHEDPWKDEETLRKEYVEKGKTREELAEQWGCGQGTIQYWQEKHNIERRDFGGGEKDATYRDKETLKRLYHEEGLSFSEVSERLDCSIGALQHWMDKHGIERRKAPQDPTHPPHHTFKKSYEHIVGSEYEVMQTNIIGTLYSFRVHRLQAVAHGILTPSEFFDPDIVVHHDSEHGLDNRPGNLCRMTRANHTGYHRSGIGQQ